MSASSPGEPTPLARAFVGWTLRWGAWIWAVALLLAIPATWRTAQLYVHLRSDMEELLPRNAPSVVAIAELRRRMQGLMHLGVLVDAGSPENVPAAERFLDDLAARVEKYPPDLVRAVRTGDAAERKFVEDHAALYADLADLQTIETRIEARRDWEVSKEQGALLDDDAPPPLSFDDIRAKYDQRTKSARRFDDDRFASKSDHLALLLIEIGSFDTGRSRAGQLFDRVKADVAALDPAKYAPGMRVGYTSDIAINVEETQALLSDLSVSSVVVVILVVAVIIFYFRWWRSVPVLLAPLLLATVFAFALASLPPFDVTDLNSNTAFLGSIIVGNGINFGIILLARYVEERRRGKATRESLDLAVWGARTGTLAAALAAGVSYTSLALTNFRGFRQFGFIGGLGMVLSWLFAFVLMPPLIAWVDRGASLPAAPKSVTSALARGLAKHRTIVVVVAAILAIAGVARVRTFGADQIETDFSKLRRADTWKNGEGYWGRRMDQLLGTYVTPTVILADAPEQARAIGHVIAQEAKVPPLDQLVASVRTLDDVLPRDQEAKIAVVDRIRDDLTPKIRSTLDADQQKLVDRFVGNGPLRPIAPQDLPEAFTIGLLERDGTMGKTALVYPRPGRLLWEGPPLADFVARLRSAATTDEPPGGRPARVAGSLALSADILEAVRRDGALTSLAAFIGVVAVVLVLLRVRWTTLMVIGSLVLGVLWLAAAMMVLGVRINFVNFIAFPITFGIGVDYSVNIASRWELNGPHTSMTDAVRDTGGAVILCSSTTIIGYSSLLLAQNRALFLFGVLAVLGEVACLSTAVIVLPAFVEWVGRLRPNRTGSA